jgi:glucose/arabinose dehydrogenase
MKRLILLVVLGGILHGRSATLPSGFGEESIGGTWNEAVGLSFAPDGRMFVWERGGRIWTVENGVKSSTPFLDIAEEVGGWRDFGLLGFALHPGFQTNGHIYLMYVVDRHHLRYFGTANYSASSNQYFNATIGRITRYTARLSDGLRSVDPASRRVLVGESATNGFPILHESHGIGTLQFGSDGTLLASCGDGASYNSTDAGSAAETYWQTALNEGIIRPKENVGAFRSQLVDCLNGKILRLDPETGNGLPSNPFFDSANPRAPRSRVWALGLRNPFRMSLRPGSGSENPADGRPGALYIGDVGYNTWEELNVCDGRGQNFGWPLFEGLEGQPAYMAATAANRDAPNPLFGTGGCTQQYFNFRDLLVQDTLNTPSWPNPCNTSQQIPSTVRRFIHRRPAIDWIHGTAADARTGIYSSGDAAIVRIGATNSPVTGSMFFGNSSTAGAWYTNTSFPPQFRNTWIHGDYVAEWIKSFDFTTNNQPTAVRNFASNAGGVVAIAVEPATGHLYYIAWTSTLRRVRYTPAVNLPPVAVASANRYFGDSPLLIQFLGDGSSDPEGQPLQYRWTFGDGSAAVTSVNPRHTFDPPANVRTNYTVTLVVTDPANNRGTNRIVISVNNSPPQVTITSPVDGTLYSVSSATTYACTANVTDAEHSPGQLRYAWQTILHHDDHEHAEPLDTNRTTSTVISPTGCDGPIYYYRVILIVTDPLGLSGTNEVRLSPNCAGSGSDTLISAGATWRYRDNGSNQGTAWRGLTFNDSGWPSGAAELGYGDGDEATVVSYGTNASSKYITTYFRRRFVVTNAANYVSLNARFVRDDGIVIYLNGTEALRNNLPAGTITFTTLALTNIGGASESVFNTGVLDQSLLREGTNVVAAEIHQAGATSTDLSFNLELIAQRPGTRPFLRAEALAGGRFRLWFHGNAETTYITERSGNLNTWSPVSTNTSSGTVEYIDVNASLGRRFFRVRMP